jgi:glycosyltransferase involved in cell wall biosynthesis
MAAGRGGAARLAIVASHPIQYHAPWFRALATRIDLRVFFCHRQDGIGQAAAGYGEAFEWDVPLLDGYPFTWLTNVSRDPNVFRFRGCDTPTIADELRAGRFDACIVTGWYLKSFLQTFFACDRLGIPAFARGDSQLSTARSTAKKLLKYWPYRFLLNRVAGHLCVGDANRRYLEHYGVPRERLFLVPHAIDTAWFGERAERAVASGAVDRIRGELGADDDTRIALFVGRLVAMKRPMDFVEAIARASKSRPIVGAMVGNGPLADDLRSRAEAIRAPIRFLGFRNQSELPAIYAAAQMIVLPSEAEETWGLVVNEAMACGVPAVVSDAAGCATDLIRPDTGLSYSVGDVEGLARAIVALDDARRSRPTAFGRALRALTGSFSPAAVADLTMAAVTQGIGVTVTP